MDLHPFKEYRQKHDFTQVDLAEILTISHASVSRIEAGKQEVTPELAERSEQLLGIPRLQLLYPDTKTPSFLSARLKSFIRAFKILMKSLGIFRR